jgi:signal transduction histidine kinase
MNSRTARLIAGGIVILSLVSVAVSIPVGLAARERAGPGAIVIVGDPNAPGMQQTLRDLERRRGAGDKLEASTANYNPVFGALVLLLLVWLGVGSLIAWRQPGNWAGWIFLITGAPFPMLTLGQPLVILGLKGDPGSVPLVGLWATLGEYALYPIALLPLLFLLYPDGHAPSRRWRWAVVGLVGGTAISFLGFLFRPGPYNNWIEDGILFENPLGIDALEGIAPLIITFGTVIALVSALSTVVAVRQRFKRATGEERQQMRWLAFVASLGGSFFALFWIVSLAGEALSVSEDAPISGILLALTAFTIVLGIPTAYLVAIFRYGLWNLDVVIKKTVQYALLVAGSTAVVGVVVAIPTLFVGVGVDVGDPVPIAIGVILAAGFMLIRTRARRWANRIVYGKRSTPYEVLSEFSDRVGGTYSTQDVLPRMAQLLGEATGSRTARVWLRFANEIRVEAAWPPEVATSPGVHMQADELPDFGAEEAFEVKHQGELLGALTVSLAPDDPMNPTKEKLIRDMAAQAGLVLRNVRLIEDLRESRRRIVTAQDERARALERNIHDGAQQQLVALTVKVGLIERLIRADAAKAEAMLAEVKVEANDALEDLRDLARGIYPPLLADQGLTAALGSQVRKVPIPVDIEPDGIGRYPKEAEAAVYFSCLEALQNVTKYAEASKATVRLAQANGTLSFEVSDDGRGFDPAVVGHGTGLQGIADRLASLGGELDVRSAPGDGTTVAGRLPVMEVDR